MHLDLELRRQSTSGSKVWLRRYLLRERINTALWVYSHIGSVGDFVKRWWQEVKENKMGVCNIVAYGLFVKKLFRLAKNK